jgi:hypothetical protein
VIAPASAVTINGMEPAGVSKPSRGWAWLWGVAMVLLVGGAGFATWHFTGRPMPGGGVDASAHAPTIRPRLPDGDYYLHVKLIELSDRRPDGKTWDVGGSAPDVRFNLTWHDNIIWESTAKADTLIGSWDLLKIDLKQVIASGGTADLESSINAPLVHHAPGETVKLTVWDDDTVDTDAAGTLMLKLDDLVPGDNTIVPAAAGDPEAKAVRRVVLTLIDRKTSVPDLIQRMSNR